MKIKEENNQVIVTFSKAEFDFFKDAARTGIEELTIVARGEVITETDQEYAKKSLASLNSIKLETEGGRIAEKYIRLWYVNGTLIYDGNTDEYKELSAMNEDVWCEFCDELAKHGCTCTYNNIHNTFTIA